MILVLINPLKAAAKKKTTPSPKNMVNFFSSRKKCFLCAQEKSPIVKSPCFFANGPIHMVIPANMYFPSYSTDGMAGIFSLTPMPQRGIELLSGQLHLLEGPKFRKLYQMSYCSGSEKVLVEFLRINHLIRNFIIKKSSD